MSAAERIFKGTTMREKRPEGGRVFQSKNSVKFGRFSPEKKWMFDF